MPEEIKTTEQSVPLEQVEQPSESAKVKAPEPILDIRVTPDQLVAYLRVTNATEGMELDPKVILDELQKKGITLGIFRAEIEEYCSQGKFFKELKVAKGREPVNGKDGSVVYHFETEQRNTPKELVDGSVDFKDLSLIRNVKKGDVICELIPPTDGISGKDVYGKEVPAKPGQPPTVNVGKNISASEDGMQFLADADGLIELDRDTISIEEIYTVTGDVGIETGNVIFNGTVVVKGNVIDGFRVEAKKDIHIEGRVEGADIKAGENVVITNGMNGMNKGTIYAGGSVTTRFLENAAVLCGGDFICDCALNSTVKSGGAIRMAGKRAALLGGTYMACDQIVAQNIGSQLNIHMDVIIAPEWYEIEINGRKWEDLDYIYADVDELKLKIREKQREAERFGAKIQEVVSGKREMASAEKAAYIKRMMGLREEKMRNVMKLEKKMQRAEDYQNSHEFSVTVKGEIYPGVRITIRDECLRINKHDTYKKYYLYAGAIESGMPTRVE